MLHHENHHLIASFKLRCILALFTLAMTTRSARDLAICLAISKGEVSQAVPSRVEPSGMVMVMGTRGWAKEHKGQAISSRQKVKQSCQPYGAGNNRQTRGLLPVSLESDILLTSVSLVSLLFELVEHGDTVSDILGSRGDLEERELTCARHQKQKKECEHESLSFEATNR